MSFKVVAMAAASAGAEFEAMLIERREPRAHDVVIDIAYAGICHSDIHQVREESGPGHFPDGAGPRDRRHRLPPSGTQWPVSGPGDRVGVGCFVDSCRGCANCRAGEEQYC